MAEFVKSEYVRPAVKRDLRLADLYLRSGDQQAESLRRSGDIQAQLWGNLGNNIAQTVLQVSRIPGENRDRAIKEAEAKQIAQSRALQIGEQEHAVNERENYDLAMSQGSRVKTLESLKGRPELYAKAQEHFTAIDNSMKSLMGNAAAGIRAFGDTPEAANAAMDDLQDQGFDPAKLKPYRDAIAADPTHVKTITDALLAQSPDPRHQQMAKPQPLEPGVVLGPGQKRFNSAGEVTAEVPPNPTAPRAAPPIEQQIAEALKAGDTETVARLTKAAELAAGAKRAPETPKESKKMWVSRAGKLVYINEGDYQPGDLPASNKEQGRPVTSGDAGRMADFDNSLKLLSSLGNKLGTTGAASKVGALLPNAVTEYTGWGQSAKSRQATIDQVKQIIGKALEGGVLRKEDEVKYEKILPTIGDPPEVAKTKIEGLIQTIGDKRQATLDALADAGYDTSKFTARGADAGKKDEGTTKVGAFTVRVKPQ